MSGEYIHERPDWPKLRWDDAKLSSLLAGVRYRQGRLLGRMEGLGFQLRSEANLTTLTTEVVKTSVIEGERLDADAVRSAIARKLGLDDGATSHASRDVEGIVEMMLDATQKYAQRLTVERLFDWHSALFPAGRSGPDRLVGNEFTLKRRPLSGLTRRHHYFWIGSKQLLESTRLSRRVWLIFGLSRSILSRMGMGALLAPSLIWLWLAPKESQNGSTARRLKLKPSGTNIICSWSTANGEGWILPHG
jgi:hypothetical protein